MSIQLDQVTKQFGQTCVLDALQLSIETGEFFVIVGASGCGKSTLLRLIAGLEEATQGRITLNGRAVSAPDRHVSPEDRECAVVFQSYALWPHMSVEDNVAFPARAAGQSRAASRQSARQHLGSVDLTDHALRKPAELSGGQRQRVALARCLASDARIILMDEPLANLDPHLRSTMEEELQAFHRQSGATTLYITHDQREAMALADRMAVMHDGRLLQVGTPSEIYTRPVNERVARFIGHGALVPVTGTQNGLVAAIHSTRHSSRQSSPTDHPMQAVIPAHAACPVANGQQALCLVRPDDVIVHDVLSVAVQQADVGSACLPAVVQSSWYRGGYWELRLQIDHIPVPLVATSRSLRAQGDRVTVEILSGWVVPDSVLPGDNTARQPAA